MIRFPVRTLLLLGAAATMACDRSPDREGGGGRTEIPAEAHSSGKESGETEESSPQVPVLSDPQRVDTLERQVESKQQSIDDLEAFVQMERAKLEEDPDYDQSFLMEALEDQQELRDGIESAKSALRADSMDSEERVRHDEWRRKSVRFHEVHRLWSL